MFSSKSVAFIYEAFVWVIGKGVHDFLPSKYIRASNWVYQPNVRFTNPAKYEEKALAEHRILKAIDRKCEIQNANDFSALKKLENKNFLKI
jgi:hypothetical protein